MDHITTSAFTQRGGRERNEDCFYVSDGTPAFIIICDGHGGEQAATESVSYMKSQMEEIKLKIIDEVTARRYFNQLFYNTQEELKKNCVYWPKSGFFSSTSGTTCSIVLVTNGYIHVAHLGDSKIIIGSNSAVGKPWKAAFESELHRVIEAKEQSRLASIGATITKNIYGYKLLSIPQTENERTRNMKFTVSKALGNLFDSKGVLFNLPTISSIKIQENMNCIVAATDGVWDVLSNLEVLNIARNGLLDSDLKKTPAMNVVSEANYKWVASKDGHLDDMTCIVMGLKDFGKAIPVETVKCVNVAVSNLVQNKSLNTNISILRSEAELFTFVSRANDKSGRDVYIYVNGNFATNMHSYLINSLSDSLSHKLKHNNNMHKYTKSKQNIINLESSVYNVEHVNTVVNYIYNGSLEVTSINLRPISKVALDFGIKHVSIKILKEMVEKFMCVEIMPVILPLACEDIPPDIKKAVKDFLTKNFEEISKISNIIDGLLPRAEQFVKLLFAPVTETKRSFFEDLERHDNLTKQKEIK